jgi:hypothetical protein
MVSKSSGFISSGQIKNLNHSGYFLCDFEPWCEGFSFSESN